MCAYQCAGFIGDIRCRRGAELSGFCCVCTLVHMRSYENKSVAIRTKRIRQMINKLIWTGSLSREDLITDIFLEIYVYNRDLLERFEAFRGVYMLKLQCMHSQGFHQTVNALRRVSGECIHLSYEDEVTCARCRRYSLALRAAKVLPPPLQSIVASYCREIWLA
jgi:hypothetical protein